MKSFHKIFIAYMIFAVIIGTFGWMPQTAKAYTTLAEWQFNGDYLDHVGQYNGTANGLSISVANNYLSLADSGDDYVTIADNDNLSFTNGAGTDEAFSISAWVKIPTGGNAVIFSKTNNTATAEYSFSLANDGTLLIVLYDATGVLGNTLFTSTNIATAYPSIEYRDTWIHVAATYDGLEATSGLKLYLNGSFTPSTSSLKQNYDGMGNTTAAVNIGHRYINDTHSYSTASIDELKLMSTEMTPTEVYNIYNSEAAEYRAASVNVKFQDGGSPIQSNVFALDTEPAFTYINFIPVKSIDAGDGIVFTMGTGIQLGTITDGTSTVSQTHDTTDISIGAGDIVVDSQDIKIIVSTASDHPAEKITYTIPANATYTLKTPLAAGPQIITAKVYDLGSDNLWGTTAGPGSEDTLESQGSAASIFGSYQVDISATVDATLSLELADWYSEPQNAVPVENGTAGTCSFGTMDSTQVRLCLYNLYVDTNADFGYTAFIRDTGNFAKDGTTDIDDSSGTISPGTEGYGVATTSTGKQIATINDFDLSGTPSVGDIIYLWDPANRTTTGVNATAVTETDKSVGGATGPVNNDATTVMHLVNISGTTEAGVYSTTSIITVVGNF